MEQFEFDTLATAAFKGERVAARRLAARMQLTEAQALLQVLTGRWCGRVGAVDGRARAAAPTRRRTAPGKTGAGGAQAGGAQGQLAAVAAWRGWFDGSAHPNPGQIGIGALLCGPDGQRVEISRRAGHGNSSEAEYLALTALLEAAVEMGATGLAVYGDSQVVVNDVNLGAARGAKDWKHIARGGGADGALGEVQLRWVPRHRNGDADRLSQHPATAAKRAVGPVPAPGGWRRWRWRRRRCAA
jgi:ribonuclease HI